MEIVEKIFTNYQAYLEFLRDKTVCEDPNYVANHERQHLERALALGYSAHYGARIVGNDFPHILIEGFVDFPEIKPTNNHLIEILLAPDKPSEDDLRLANDLIKRH